MNMLTHYFVVAFRNLIRHKAFTAINVIGLALGMTCCLFIFLWVKSERRVDNFHQNGKDLYALYTTFNSPTRIGGAYNIPLSLGTTEGSDNLLLVADEMKKTFPEVRWAASYATGYELPWGHPETFQVGEKVFKFEGSRASEDFFKMFTFPLLVGDVNTALSGVTSVAISRKMSDMFFNSPSEALGKSIRFENATDLMITAVFENVPFESSLKFDYLIAWDTFLSKRNIIETASGQGQAFIQLNPQADISNVNRKIAHFLDNRVDKNGGYKLTLGLQKFGDQYLISNFENGIPSGGRIEYVKIFTGVALFILLMACINFMNLATARSVKRAKEVGVRKVVGSSRLSLIIQFFGESLLISVFALSLSVIIVIVILPAFNSFTGKQITQPFDDSNTWLLSVQLLLLTGLVAGSYPALFLSSLKPVTILKGIVRFTSGAVWFRKGLAVFQFVLSIGLLIATIVVSQQMSFIQNTNLGFDRENLIYIRVEGALNPKYNAFKSKAENTPGILKVDRSSEAPHDMSFTVADAINWEGKPTDLSVGFKPTSVGFDFVKLMNLKVVEGRDFSKSFPSDTGAFMINEEAAKQMGVKDPVGRWISAWGKKGTIIGVLKDYHTNSLKESIKPLIVDVKEDLYFGVILVRTEAGKTKEAIANLEKVYSEFNPGYPFAYQFLDEEYGKLYRNEQVMAKLSNAFALIAIMISCLGLLGLVMFSAEQRVKEIGIRKVLGASVGGIVGLLARDFLKIVLLSFIIAAPIAGFYMNRWLQQFNFKIGLSWWIFVLAGGATLLLALITISSQAIQSAAANPVKSLRSE